MSFWRSNNREYSGFAKLLHWISAVTVVGLFILGLWMTGLSYYDSWYRTGPDLHKSIGVALMLVTVIRLIYRWTMPSPGPQAAHSAKVKVAAKLVHLGLYGLLFVMFVSGYLITTAKGEPLVVFGGLIIPAVVNGIDNLEDLAGEIHEIAAFTLVGLAVLHALAALKHHFIDRDDTFLRMIGRGKNN